MFPSQKSDEVMKYVFEETEGDDQKNNIHIKYSKAVKVKHPETTKTEGENIITNPSVSSKITTRKSNGIKSNQSIVSKKVIGISQVNDLPIPAFNRQMHERKTKH